MQAIVPDSPPVTAEGLKLSRTFDFKLEALRGFAAMAVVWHHFILHKYWLDPHYAPGGIFRFNPSGHLSVLVFFVLSGYVIGRVHLLPLTKKDILLYLKKRFVRIYPIYFVTMAFGLAVAQSSYSPATIFSNLTLAASVSENIIFENNPAWSLGFELVFYLLFVPLSFFRLNAAPVAGAFAVLGAVTSASGHYVLGAYGLGFAVWLCGVMLARRLQHSHAPSFALMVSLLFLLLSLEQFNILRNLLVKLTAATSTKLDLFQSGGVQVLDVANLPYCVLLVLVFSSREFAYKKYVVGTLVLAPMLLFHKSLRIHRVLENPETVLPILFYTLAVAIYFCQKQAEKISQVIIHGLAKTGAISYGLYMVHFPIIATFKRIDWFSGTALTFSVRLLGYLLLCGLGAYFLEKKFQPWIKQLFFSAGS